ncbi:MAG: hypothetical protein RR576_07455 [Oscillospiraceae bacterium]
MKPASILLLDNSAVLQILHGGHFRVQEISFEEAKAIVDMYDTRSVKRCFQNSEIADLLYRHLNIAVGNFDYSEPDELLLDQDAIVFRTYTTPSETQPSIKTEYGNEATKVQNIYIHCQYITKYDPEIYAVRDVQA